TSKRCRVFTKGTTTFGKKTKERKRQQRKQQQQQQKRGSSVPPRGDSTVGTEKKAAKCPVLSETLRIKALSEWFM
ncbi:hypothetical protein RUM43_009944, partial [Polyplax serrata]